ncbi:MAG: hypothetical protein MR269_05940 [Clostridiales bacterium]|nr:hypothetical protein [Clostridiales bacterium]
MKLHIFADEDHAHMQKRGRNLLNSEVMEKMRKERRDYLTVSEWNTMKKLAIDNYPEYNWEKGGYGNYEKFNFVKKDKTE